MEDLEETITYSGYPLLTPNRLRSAVPTRIERPPVGTPRELSRTIVKLSSWLSRSLDGCFHLL
jgi:hypothetical protein